MAFENRYKILIILAFLVAAFFTFYKLTESPHVWQDEGIIAQVPRNIAYFGKGLIQVVPGEFTSAGSITTSYPVTYPIALIFKLFGVGILQARLVMAAFIMSFFTALYFLIRKKSISAVLCSLFLLASFAPIYGNGKNVLGEVPGLFYLILFLIFIDRALSDMKRSDFAVAGLFLGLCAVTKPIFLVLIPAFLVVLFLYKREALKIFFENKINVLWFVTPVFFAFLVWFFAQFSGDSLRDILSYYSNPYSLNLKEAIFSNLARFIKEAQPIYFLAAMIAWLVSIVIRRKDKALSDFGEMTAFAFSALILLAYLRTPGYYRYFFPGQVLALAYLPNSLLVIFKGNIKKILIISCLILLVAAQLYQTMFNSWISGSFNNTGTAKLEAYFKNADKIEEILVFNAAEILMFLPHNNYRQYHQYHTEGSQTSMGDENLALLEGGLVKKVIATEKFWDKSADYAKYYIITDRVDKYIILESIK